MRAVGCSYAHVFVREDPNWTGFTDEYLICPLRDPALVWESWVKRWNTGKGAVALELFDLQWRHLEALDREYDIVYIPLDGKGDGHLEGLTETDVVPDWDYIYSLPMVSKFYDLPGERSATNGN